MGLIFVVPVITQHDQQFTAVSAVHYTKIVSSPN